MRTMLLLALTVALAAPIAAFADPTAPTPASTATQTCKQEQANMSATLFAQTYAGSGPAASAFGKCVSSHQKNAQDQVGNATQTCKAQQADPDFAAGHGGKTFDQFYGSNNSKGKGADSNALGKCVSQTVSQAASAQAKADTGAAKTCKAARTSDATAFASKWGKGKNAFGKCVASTAKSK